MSSYFCYSINDLTNMHWSLPRSKTSPHRHKVLTNGSIMTSQNGGGSQGVPGGLGGGGLMIKRASGPRPLGP